MSDSGYSGIRTEVDFSEWVDDLKKLPDAALKAAKVQWYKVGAAHLARTKANTPVGQYSNQVDFWTRDGKHVQFTIKKVRIGGQLRIRWQQTPAVLTNESVITTIVFNNTEYAPYVEFGHRIRNKEGVTIGFVPGRFMMTSSLRTTQDIDIPAAIIAIMDDIRRTYNGTT